MTKGRCLEHDQADIARCSTAQVQYETAKTKMIDPQEIYQAIMIHILWEDLA